MVLANRAKLQNSRSLVRVFGGLNETYACSEAEYSAGVNFSARDFPALSTRKPRRKLRTLTGLNGMYHLNGLLTVCGKDLVYTPDDGGETVTCTDAVADSKKALVGLGTKILIFPDKVAFDTADGSVSALGACWKAEGQSVEFAPCDAEGRTYTPTGVGREEPESPADGQIFLKVEDEEHPWRYDGTLEVYSAASGNWTALPLDYCRITAAGAQEKFCQWDTVTVQGTAAKQAGQWEALDGDCVVYAVTENSLCVRADPAGDYFYGTLVQGADSARWTSLDIDGWVGLVVAGFILFSGVKSARETISPLLGQPPEKEFVDRIESIVLSHPAILGLHDLVVHDYGPGRVMVSLHAEVPAHGDLLELHDIVDNIEMDLSRQLNCQAVIHMDPVVTDDERLNQLHAQVQQIVAGIDSNLSMHDFRAVFGPTHTNLVFDVVVPPGFSLSDGELSRRIEQQVQTLGSYFCVITVDHNYAYFPQNAK